MSFRDLSMTLGRLAGIAAGCIGIAAGGCGGAGGTGTGQPGGAQTETVGQAQVSFTGSPKAISTGSSGAVSTVGQAGAAYSYLALLPAPNLASTYLAFSRGGTNGTAGDSQVYTTPIAAGATPTVLSTAGLSNRYPTCSQTGLIALESWTAPSTWNIYTFWPDGTKVSSLLYGTAPVNYIPALSPDGSTLVYAFGTTTLFSIPATGGTIKKIYTAPAGDSLAVGPVVWSPDSTKIAFSIYSGSSTQILILTLATGTTAPVTPANGAGAALVPNSWSPDAATLACTDYNLANVVLVNLATDQFAEITPTTVADSLPTFSPDGQKIAFYRTGDTTHGIYVCDFNGANPQLLLADPLTTGATGPVTGLFWSFFPLKKVFVGSGALLGSSASGFLLTQNGSQFASLLAFTAKTPSTATTTPPAVAQPGASLLYTVTADSITNFSYANSYYGSATSISGTGITTLVVSIDGTTGQVDLVAPAILMNKSASRAPAAGFTYSGQFSAIYDGAGKNLAPSGATSIQIDPSTGKLISFQ